MKQERNNEMLEANATRGLSLSVVSESVAEAHPFIVSLVRHCQDLYRLQAIEIEADELAFINS
jgi:hypothetical protein